MGDMLKVAPDLLRLDAVRNLFRFSSRYFKSDKLRQVFSFETLLVGGNPLSVPAIYERIARHERVTVQALDREGRPFEMQAEGLSAVCVQHEMDHLDGKVFVEYLSPLKRDRIRTRLLKRAREAQRA
jgi:hypothetical protein